MILKKPRLENRSFFRFKLGRNGFLGRTAILDEICLSQNLMSLIKRKVIARHSLHGNVVWFQWLMRNNNLSIHKFTLARQKIFHGKISCQNHIDAFFWYFLIFQESFQLRGSFILRFTVNSSTTHQEPLRGDKLMRLFTTVILIMMLLEQSIFLNIYHECGVV